MPACGVVDYDFNRENLFASSSKQKNIGVVYFNFSGGEETTEVRFRRVKGGYALLSPIYEDGKRDGTAINFTASRTKERDMFFGVEGKYKF